MLLIFFVSGALQAQTSTYNPESSGGSQKEFIMSCTYGVLAGTLIGAATLAFVDKPSDNLNKVARGASIGLYAGILLGAYVTYIVPSMEEDPYEHPYISSSLLVNPLFNEEGQMDGAELGFQFLSF